MEIYFILNLTFLTHKVTELIPLHLDCQIFKCSINFLIYADHIEYDTIGCFTKSVSVNTCLEYFV